MNSLTEPKTLGSALMMLLGALCVSPGTASAQVHYHEDGSPWKQRADRGPDAEVDGWYYNLGITGIRVQLVPEAPKHLLVKHVFEDTPAYRRVRPGDLIVGVNGEPFRTEHKNGYGMDKFGPDGPILEFARALEASQGAKGKGRLTLNLLRDGKPARAALPIGTKYGTFSRTFPGDCPKTKRILGELYRYLAEHQQEDGSWGSPPLDLFAPLALLASEDPRYLPLVAKNVRMHARTTQAEDESWLINWRYMAAAIVMSEYYLLTKKSWVPRELDEVYRFLLSSQYTDMSQINPKTREERPQDLPKSKMGAHGGWGHNPGFEGYGPISMLTAQGALALALMKHCGIDVDRKRHDMAYDFLTRGTGLNGYLWYEDKVAGDKDWADMGRTGAAGVANFLSPYQDGKYRARALKHALVIGEHPESFPDTHGSPVMGMGFAAAAASVHAESFRRLMDANKWWFVLAQCADGSFYYQPNRDNAGYGGDSRLSATAVTAFILSIDRRSLHITGKPFKAQ